MPREAQIEAGEPAADDGLARVEHSVRRSERPAVLEHDASRPDGECRRVEIVALHLFPDVEHAVDARVEELGPDDEALLLPVSGRRARLVGSREPEMDERRPIRGRQRTVDPGELPILLRRDGRGIVQPADERGERDGDCQDA